MPEDLQKLFDDEPRKISEEEMTGEFKELIEQLYEQQERSEKDEMQKVKHAQEYEGS